MHKSRSGQPVQGMATLVCEVISMKLCVISWDFELAVEVSTSLIVRRLAIWGRSYCLFDMCMSGGLIEIHPFLCSLFHVDGLWDGVDVYGQCSVFDGSAHLIQPYVDYQ